MVTFVLTVFNTPESLQKKKKKKLDTIQLIVKSEYN